MLEIHIEAGAHPVLEFGRDGIVLAEVEARDT
jgi:hypothetical protein